MAFVAVVAGIPDLNEIAAGGPVRELQIHGGDLRILSYGYSFSGPVAVNYR